jgi:hypothetical protein
VAGHHAVVGAAAGCVIEHHREKEKEKAALQNGQSRGSTQHQVMPRSGLFSASN